jgi:hypothetical protein
MTLRTLDDLFIALAKSRFRSGFRLGAKDFEYLQSRGLPLVLSHAADFVDQRLAPAHIANDGKQTPFRGHPVFVAQHATACCCRSCLQKWHRIPAGRALGAEEKRYVLSVLQRWLQQQLDGSI